MRPSGFQTIMLGLVIGCAPMPLEPNEKPADQGKYVAGSVQVVSRRAQNLLQSLGLTVAVTPEGEGMRLHCTTASNGHFSLVMIQANTAEGERTQVRLDWEDGVDESLGIRVMAGLGVLGGL